MPDFVENGEGVHLEHGEFTLCGDSFDIGDTEYETDGNTRPTKSKTVTCPRCAEIIRMCRGVRIKAKPR